MNPLANVRLSQHEGVPVVAVDGEVDIANVGVLRSQVMRAVPNTAPGLILDLSGTSYLDSRGVHLILEIADRMITTQQQLRVVAPEGGLIRRVLMLTHVEGVVPLHHSLDEAISHFRPTPRPS
jgi:anti-anti-sigma factor